MNDYTLRKDWPLTDEQNEIIDFILKRTKCVCSAQTGFGKTYLSCTAICHILLKYSDTHAIILVPQKAIKAFKKELSQKLRVAFNVLSSGKPEITNGARITIVTHTSLRKHLDFIKDLKKEHRLILAVDEAHILSSKDSCIYKYLASIRHIFSVCWFLTATPLKNSIEGLYWLLYMLDPKILGEWDYFKSKYLILERHPAMRVINKDGKKIRRRVFNEDIAGYQNVSELKEILNQYIIIKQKPYNLKFIYHKTQLNDRETYNYLEAGKGLIRESSKDSFAVRMHDLQMTVDNIVEESRIWDSLSSKELLFISIIKNKIANKHPTLVYCDYNEVVERLASLLNVTKSITGVKQILKITGGIPQKEREKIEDVIDENTVVLITSAGTESINLQKADSLVFYDIPFSIVTFLQAVGRVTRMDSKFSEQYIHLLECEGTIDSYKRCLVKINGGLIMSMFGKMETLPLDVGQIDRNVTRKLKNNLLWCFNQKRLLTDEELSNIIVEGKKECNNMI